MQENVLWYQQLGMGDVSVVGGKNASLGEMISNLSNAGVQVPGGFATTASAFNLFLEQSGLEARIHKLLDSLDVDDIPALGEAGKAIRQWIIETPVKKHRLQYVHLQRQKICQTHHSRVNKKHF